MKSIVSTFLLSLFVISVWAKPKEVKIKLIHTTDVHGNFFPYDFISNHPSCASMANVSTYVNKQRKEYSGNVLLLDGGDLLQGQPAVYYYNFLDTISTHFCAEVMNYLKYDAITLGNHDLETGHSVYDRWIGQCDMPVLGANILKKDGTNYLKPYKVFVLDGVKIAVLGMTTSAIPAFLPPNLWEGLMFADMEKTAKKWMKVIKEKEQPDLVVGLFHAGVNFSVINNLYHENASLEVAKRVPGFDIVLAGHDHSKFCKKIINVDGDSVLVINPSNDAQFVSNVSIRVNKEGDKLLSKSVKGKFADMKKYASDCGYMTHFATQYSKINDFVNRRIGQFEDDIESKDAYFGSSAFIDLVHEMQLKISGADVSFTAPLSYNYHISKGDIYVRDMFKLYSYENMLCCMKLKGSEIKGFLEESYSRWANQMKTPNDHLLQIIRKEDGSGYGFRNYGYNFDSAAGVFYTVDVTKPYGKRINILKMANGEPFSLTKQYKVAINSYRANGGGEIITKGAGIDVKDLRSRIIASYPKDLRYYLMKVIEDKKTVMPRALNQWKFIPEKWTVPAAAIDRELLFNEKK